MIIPIRCFSCGKVRTTETSNIHVRAHLTATRWSQICTRRIWTGYHKGTPTAQILSPRMKGQFSMQPNMRAVLILCSEVMDQLGLNRYCCRRMIMTHVDLIEKLLRWVYLNFLCARGRSSVIGTIPKNARYSISHNPLSLWSDGHAGTGWS